MELGQLCDARGIKGYESLKKPEIISLLMRHKTAATGVLPFANTSREYKARQGPGTPSTPRDDSSTDPWSTPASPRSKRSNSSAAPSSPHSKRSTPFAAPDSPRSKGTPRASASADRRGPSLRPTSPKQPHNHSVTAPGHSSRSGGSNSALLPVDSYYHTSRRAPSLHANGVAPAQLAPLTPPHPGAPTSPNLSSKLTPLVLPAETAGNHTPSSTLSRPRALPPLQRPAVLAPSDAHTAQASTVERSPSSDRLTTWASPAATHSVASKPTPLALPGTMSPATTNNKPVLTQNSNPTHALSTKPTTLKLPDSPSLQSPTDKPPPAASAAPSTSSSVHTQASTPAPAPAPQQQTASPSAANKPSPPVAPKSPSPASQISRRLQQWLAMARPSVKPSDTPQPSVANTSDKTSTPLQAASVTTPSVKTLETSQASSATKPTVKPPEVVQATHPVSNSSTAHPLLKPQVIASSPPIKISPRSFSPAHAAATPSILETVQPPVLQLKVVNSQQTLPQPSHSQEQPPSPFARTVPPTGTPSAAAAPPLPPSSKALQHAMSAPAALQQSPQSLPSSLQPSSLQQQPGKASGSSPTAQLATASHATSARTSTTPGQPSPVSPPSASASTPPITPPRLARPEHLVRPLSASTPASDQHAAKYHKWRRYMPYRYFTDPESGGHYVFSFSPHALLEASIINSPHALQRSASEPHTRPQTAPNQANPLAPAAATQPATQGIPVVRPATTPAAQTQPSQPPSQLRKIGPQMPQQQQNTPTAPPINCVGQPQTPAPPQNVSRLQTQNSTLQTSTASQPLSAALTPAMQPATKAQAGKQTSPLPAVHQVTAGAIAVSNPPAITPGQPAAKQTLLLAHSAAGTRSVSQQKTPPSPVSPPLTPSPVAAKPPGTGSRALQQAPLSEPRNVLNNTQSTSAQQSTSSVTPNLCSGTVATPPTLRRQSLVTTTQTSATANKPRQTPGAQTSYKATEFDVMPKASMVKASHAYKQPHAVPKASPAQALHSYIPPKSAPSSPRAAAQSTPKSRTPTRASDKLLQPCSAPSSPRHQTASSPRRLSRNLLPVPTFLHNPSTPQPKTPKTKSGSGTASNSDTPKASALGRSDSARPMTPDVATFKGPTQAAWFASLRSERLAAAKEHAVWRPAMSAGTFS